MSDNNSLDERYWEWLYSFIGEPNDRNPARTHHLLCGQMYQTPFDHYVPNDHNRAGDGIALRTSFMEATGTIVDYAWLSLDCSVFEMLVALSQRASYQNGMEPSAWFWHMMDNLELSKYTDENYHDGVRGAVAEALSNLNNRTYDPSGLGGLFPLRNSPSDQRKTEIWYQMSAYLMENNLIP